jgi:hypothetical protein
MEIETDNVVSHPERFSIRKRGIFSPGKEIEGLRGGVHRYAAQASLKIDAARAEKVRFRMKTRVAQERFATEEKRR